jgi:hypothetical protein
MKISDKQLEKDCLSREQGNRTSTPIRQYDFRYPAGDKGEGVNGKGVRASDEPQGVGTKFSILDEVVHSWLIHLDETLSTFHAPVPEYN